MPLAQLVHVADEEAAIVGENLPAAQLVHACAAMDAAANLPAPQLVQTPPAAANLPAAQAAQSLPASDAAGDKDWN